MRIKDNGINFFSIFLLAAGIGFTVAGIIFFFAYNWDELPKFAKLGMVEVLLATSVLLAVFTWWSTLVKQVLLTGATFLTGTLLPYSGKSIRPEPMHTTYSSGGHFYLSLGSSYPFRPVVADIYRTTQYNNMAVCNTNSTRSFVDQRFAHQRSNLDMRHINDRCGANEHKRAVE